METYNYENTKNISGHKYFIGVIFLQHPAFVKAEETDPLNSLQTFCNEVIRIDGTEEGNNLLKELLTVQQQWKEIISSEKTREKGAEILVNTIQACEKRTYAYKTGPFYLYQMLAQSKSSKALDFLIHEANTPLKIAGPSFWLGNTLEIQVMSKRLIFYARRPMAIPVNGINKLLQLRV